MTHIKREQVVVSSLLSEPGSPIGKNLSTALAYAPQHWHSPEAAKVAEAIGKCISKGWRTTPRNVALLLEPDYKKWTTHPTFQDGLPLGLADFEASQLLPVYRDQRIIAIVAQCYQNMLSRPEKAKAYAEHLIGQLEGWI